MTETNPVSEAVVLAGGVGSRLFPLTKTMPKPLVPVGNYSMLDWNLHLLSNCGIKKVVLVVKYLGDQIREHIRKYGNELHPELEIVIPDVDPKDTADAVRRVSNHVSADNFFVSMADIITNIDLRDMANFHLRKQGLASISLKSINTPRQFGVILLNNEGRILLFLEKPRPQELYMTTLMFHRRESTHFHANLVNTGIYAFRHDLLDILNDFGDLMDFGKNVFPFLLERQRGVFGYTSPHPYYWQDCGKAEQLLWANHDVVRRWNWPYLPRGEERDGSWYGPEIGFGSNLNIQPPVVVGTKTVLGEGTTLTPMTVMGAGCQVEAGVTINAAVLWDNVTVGAGSELNKCIIANDAVIGENCTIGEMAVVAAGMKVPNNTVVQPGETVE